MRGCAGMRSRGLPLTSTMSAAEPGRNRPSSGRPRNAAASEVAARRACSGDIPASTSNESSFHRLNPGGTGPQGTSVPASTGTPLSSKRRTKPWAAPKALFQRSADERRAARLAIHDGRWHATTSACIQPAGRTDAPLRVPIRQRGRRRDARLANGIRNLSLPIERPVKSRHSPRVQPALRMARPHIRQDAVEVIKLIHARPRRSQDSAARAVHGHFETRGVAAIRHRGQPCGIQAHVELEAVDALGPRSRRRQPPHRRDRRTGGTRPHARERARRSEAPGTGCGASARLAIRCGGPESTPGHCRCRGRSSRHTQEIAGLASA